MTSFVSSDFHFLVPQSFYTKFGSDHLNNYDGLESPMLHTNFRENRPVGSGEEDF